MVLNEFDGLDFFVDSLFGSDSFVRQYNDLIFRDEIKGVIPRIFDDLRGNVSFNDLLFNAYCDFGNDAIFEEALEKFGSDYSFDEEVVGELKEDKFDFKEQDRITNKSQLMRPKRLLGFYANARETNRLYSEIKDFREEEIISTLKEIRDKGLSRPYQLNLDMIRNMYGQFEKAKIVLDYIGKSMSGNSKDFNDLRKKADFISDELLKRDRDFITKDSFDIEDYLDSNDGIENVEGILRYKKENASIDNSFYNPKRIKGLDFLEFSEKDELREGENFEVLSEKEIEQLSDSSSLFFSGLLYSSLVLNLKLKIETNMAKRLLDFRDFPYLITLEEVYDSTKSFDGEIDTLRDILRDIENLKRKKLSGEYSNLDFDEKRVEEFSKLLDEIDKFKEKFTTTSEYKELDLKEALSKRYGDGKGYLYSVLSGLTNQYGEFYSGILQEVHNFEGHIKRKDTKNLIPSDIDGKTTKLFEELKGHITQLEPSIGKAGEIFSESGAFGTLYHDVDRMKERILGSAKESEGNISGDDGENKIEEETNLRVVDKVKLERVYDISRYKCRDIGQYVKDVSKVLKEKLGDEFPDKISDIFDVKIYAKDDDPNKISGEDRLKCVEDRLNVIFNQYFSFPREGKNPDYEILPLIDETFSHFSENNKKDRHFVKELNKAVKARDISVLSYESLLKIQNEFFGEYRVPAFGGHDFTLSLFMNKNELDRANKELSDVLKIDKNADYEGFYNERGDVAKRKIEGLFCGDYYKGTKGKTMEEEGLEAKAKEIGRLFTDPKDFYNLEIKIKSLI
ncbi:MAG TPA: hypothetical protein PLX15_00340 [Candidatus Woesearchaeota archaeon]|nr:hypothetical protein [Candidatus Woesearchaeota archaeon]